MKRTAVYIATTEGPSEIQRITPEDSDVRSVICHDGKAIALPISADYDSFVRRPTGVIEACFRHSAFRVDISHPIASGLSWQLGLFIAHALHDEGALVRSDDKTPQIVSVTGEVTRDLTVAAVEDIDLKIRRSEDLIRRHLANGSRVVLAVPIGNLPETEQAIEDLFAEDKERLSLVVAETVCDVTVALGLKRHRRMRQWLSGAPAAIAGRKRVPRTLAYAASIALLLLTVSIGWQRMGPEAGYMIAKAQDVAANRVVQVIPATLKVEPSAPLKAVSVASRAPEGKPCAAVHLDRVAPMKTERVVADGEPVAPMRVPGLCDLRYRLTNSSDRTSTVWVMARRANADDTAFRIRPFHAEQRLAAGASLVLDARPPRTLSAPLRQSFMVLSLPAHLSAAKGGLRTLWAQAVQAKSDLVLQRILATATAQGAQLRSITHDFRP